MLFIACTISIKKYEYCIRILSVSGQASLGSQIVQWLKEKKLVEVECFVKLDNILSESSVDKNEVSLQSGEGHSVAEHLAIVQEPFPI